MKKKNEIIFHIGTHKTGSTALQKFFIKNQNTLKKHNYIYYPCNNGINHMDLSHNISLWDDIDLDPSKNYIFSSEDFFSRFFASNEEPKIVTLLREKSEIFKDFEVKVVVYLREQSDYLQSVYNELIKRHGYFKEISEEIVSTDYLNRLKVIENLVSKENIIVRIYDRNHFFNHNIFDDFIHSCSLSNIDSLEINNQYINNALPIKALVFMKAINSCCSDHNLRTEISQKIISIYAKENSNAVVKNDLSFFTSDEIIGITEKNKYQNRDLFNTYLSDNLHFKEIGDNFLDNNEKINQHAAINEVLDKISPLVPHLIKKIKSHLIDDNNKQSEVGLRAKSIILKNLLTKEEKENININFFNLHSADLSDYLVADILRELALNFENEEEYSVAISLLKHAHKLRPNGIVINKKIEELEKWIQ